MCRLASVVKLSDEDLAALFPGEAPEAVLPRIRAWNPEAWWMYTEGARGATLHTPGGAWHAAAPPRRPTMTPSRR